jgi:hypothetical protein
MVQDVRVNDDALALCGLQRRQKIAVSVVRPPERKFCARDVLTGVLVKGSEANPWPERAPIEVAAATQGNPGTSLRPLPQRPNKLTGHPLLSAGWRCAKVDYRSPVPCEPIHEVARKHLAVAHGQETAVLRVFSERAVRHETERGGVAAP